MHKKIDKMSSLYIRMTYRMYFELVWAMNQNGSYSLNMLYLLENFVEDVKYKET